MAITTRIRKTFNQLLRPFNLHLDTLTATNHELKRVASLMQEGKLDTPVYKLAALKRFDPTLLVDAYASFKEPLERLKDPTLNKTGYDPANDYFATPDADILYLLVRTLMPNRVVEVGCGNSTRITRQAVHDGGLSTKIAAIDPMPRVDIAGLVDRYEQRRLEDIIDLTLFEELDRNDFLFIDSSHKVAIGNDVVCLFCKIIPALKKGVVVHVHDVFLPYEYPPSFALKHHDWTEQYLLHAMISGRDCEVIWPGHHVQRDRPDLHGQLPFIKSGSAQSFWFRWS